MENNELLQKIEKLENEMAEIKASRGLRAFLRRALSKSSFIVGVVLAAALTGFLAWAAQNTFVDGTVISAAAVNNNFNELYAAKWGVNGSNYYYNSGNVGIGTDSPGAKLEVNGTVKMFGNWNGGFIQGNSYLAPTDGFVLAYGNAGNTIGLTDSSNPPTTIRVFSASSTYSSITLPVRKGDYWKVSNATTIYWLGVGQ